MLRWHARIQKMADDWNPHTKSGRFNPANVLNLRHMHSTFGRGPAFPYHEWPLANVWLGVSVEDQKTADERIQLLLQTPSATRFVSYEPALGPVDFARWLPLRGDDGACQLCGFLDSQRGHAAYCTAPHLDHVIAGGESGPGARMADPAWFRSARDRCGAAGVAYFFKQWGEWVPYREIGACGWIRTKDSSDRYFGRINFDDDRTHPNAHLAKRDLETRYSADDDGCTAECMVKVGKKVAGALLDGREHKEFPQGAGKCAT
jgi:hypothetical protein